MVHSTWRMTHDACCVESGGPTCSACSACCTCCMRGAWRMAHDAWSQVGRHALHGVRAACVARGTCRAEADGLTCSVQAFPRASQASSRSPMDPKACMQYMHG
eukprot:358519-Chlamydomonas_euryale.AAC.9